MKSMFFLILNVILILQAYCSQVNDIPIAQKLGNERTFGEFTATELLKLHNRFQFDPEYLPLNLIAPENAALIQHYQERLDQAEYVRDRFKLKPPITPLEKEYCYLFSTYLSDPLCNRYLDEISQVDYAAKHDAICHYMATLEDRFLFTKIYTQRAKELYEEIGLDEALTKRSLDLIEKYQYLFATVMFDPMLDDLLEHFPKEPDVPIELRRKLIDRLRAVRTKLQEWDAMECAGDYRVEQALYYVLDLHNANLHPFDMINFLGQYTSDKTPEIYAAFFTQQHINKLFSHNLELLENIVIPSDIGLKKNLGLRIMYERATMMPYTNQAQFESLQLLIHLIMRACKASTESTDPSYAYRVLASCLYEEIQFQDVPDILLNNKELLANICTGNDIYAFSAATVMLNFLNGHIAAKEAMSHLDRISG